MFNKQADYWPKGPAFGAFQVRGALPAESFLLAHNANRRSNPRIKAAVEQFAGLYE
ncbi:hypothetical protein [Hymenobacter jeollabukensis]|uniref:hypothetical protein n=1 Tax=Hymenobacter jeollabukensis TaxID=2025313 RepID=UPI001BB18CB4|nr:hypothetical protein [Hymenobacter jeollabukensis]